MRGRIERWGDSAAVRIPASVLAAARLRDDQPVEVRATGGRIVIEPANAPLDLATLVDAITDENRHEVVEFGVARGAEE